jgi:hypothetical protein
MDRASATSAPEVLGRYLALDEQGSGLRATWRPTHGFTNLSLWRGDVCIETFHLSPPQMGELIAFLGTSLGSSQPAPPMLRVVQPSDVPEPQGSSGRRAFDRARAGAARALDAIAAHVRPNRDD